jgi:hypothetical protein
VRGPLNDEIALGNKARLIRQLRLFGKNAERRGDKLGNKVMLIGQLRLVGKNAERRGEKLGNKERLIGQLRLFGKNVERRGHKLGFGNEVNESSRVAGTKTEVRSRNEGNTMGVLEKGLEWKKDAAESSSNADAVKESERQECKPVQTAVSKWQIGRTVPR